MVTGRILVGLFVNEVSDGNPPRPAGEYIYLDVMRASTLAGPRACSPVSTFAAAGPAAACAGYCPERRPKGTTSAEKKTKKPNNLQLLVISLLSPFSSSRQLTFHVHRLPGGPPAAKRTASVQCLQPSVPRPRLVADAGCGAAARHRNPAITRDSLPQRASTPTWSTERRRRVNWSRGHLGRTRAAQIATPN